MPTTLTTFSGLMIGFNVTEGDPMIDIPVFLQSNGIPSEQGGAQGDPGGD